MFISEQYGVIFNMSGEYWDELSYQAYLVAPNACRTRAHMRDTMLFQAGL